MAHKRLGTPQSRSLANTKKVLAEKHKDKTKSQLTDADVIEYVKEVMSNDLSIPDS
jgi:hypothetical protein